MADSDCRFDFDNSDRANFDKRYEKFFTLLSQAVNNTTTKRKERLL